MMSKRKTQKTATSPRTGVGAFIKGLLLSDKDVDTILEMVHNVFPQSRISRSSIFVYRSDMRRAGQLKKTTKKKPSTSKGN